MQCGQCSSDLPAGAKFCSECGARTAVVCATCGTPSNGGRFCSECGSAYTSAPVPAARAPIPAPVSERRLTSVLFGDLVGFTTLSESRDPDDVRELLSRYFAMARTVVERYGGTVEKFIGDAVMAVWGVPVAHEDDAERAVRAGIDLTAALAALGDDNGVPGLTMRVGIVTGEVAVTLGAVGEGMVAGDAVNTAARVQAAAEPGEVWVDEATRALTAAAVTYTDAGVHPLKGKTEPVALFRASRVIAAVGGAQRVDGLEAPFTGRDRELRLVKELLHATAEDLRPRLVSVTGAPGVGKSRLGWEFEKYVDGISMIVRWHRGRCLSYGEGVAFWALAEMMRARIGAIEGDPTSVVDRKLDEHLGDVVPDPGEREWVRARVSALLGSAGARSAFTRQELFAAWALFLERQSDGRRVVVLVVEDVHHADSGLLDFFDYLLDRAQFPLFVLTLGRPEITESRPQWGSGRRATAVHLEPLPMAAMATLVDGLVADLPADVRSTLVERAEGIPLYAVETVRALIDRDAVVPHGGRYVLADSAEGLDLAVIGAPASLHALVNSRLDRLSPVERVALQNAAVLGLAFTAEGLAALTGSADVETVLDSLTAKELIAPDNDRWSAERGQYRFVQAIVRTVAYETLARRDRKSRHLAAITHLRAALDADELPGVLAAHYLAARDAAPADEDAPVLAAQAGMLLQQAGERAAGLGSPAEAQRYYEAALELTDDDERVATLSLTACEWAIDNGDFEGATRLADTARDAATARGDEITAAIALAWGARAVSQFGNRRAILSELTPVYESLVGRADADRALQPLANVLALSHSFIGEHEIALAYGDRAMALAERESDPALLIRSASTLSGILASLGRSFTAMALLRAGLDLARAQHVPGIGGTSYNNLISLLRFRRLPEALALATEGIADARVAGDRNGLTFLVANQVTGLWVAGRWDELEAAVAQYDDWGRIGSPTERLMDLALLMVEVARGGDGSTFAAGAISANDDYVLQANELLGAAVLADAAGDVAECRRLVLESEALQYSLSATDDDYSLVWMLAIDAAAAAGDVESVGRVLARVTDAAPGSVPDYLKALLPRGRAVEAALDGGDPAAVDDGFTQSAEALRVFGAPFDVACTQLRHAEWLQGEGRGLEAQLLLDEAEAGFAALRATRWLERVADRRVGATR